MRGVTDVRHWSRLAGSQSSYSALCPHRRLHGQHQRRRPHRVVIIVGVVVVVVVFVDIVVIAVVIVIVLVVIVLVVVIVIIIVVSVISVISVISVGSVIVVVIAPLSSLPSSSSSSPSLPSSSLSSSPSYRYCCLVFVVVGLPGLRGGGPAPRRQPLLATPRRPRRRHWRHVGASRWPPAQGVVAMVPGRRGGQRHAIQSTREIMSFETQTYFCNSSTP